MICFITGGARSGKSSFAQRSALKDSNSPIYVATAPHYPDDPAFTERIKRHQADRDERWTSFEEPLYPSRLPLEKQTVVIDCVTLWLSNLFGLTKTSIDDSLSLLKKEIDQLCTMEANLYIVSNEIGMGLHAETEIGRKFTDLQGMANQYIARKADQVIFMVSGLPLTIK